MVILPSALMILLSTTIITLFLPRRQSKIISITGLILALFGLNANAAFMWDTPGKIFAIIMLFTTGCVLSFSKSERERISLFVLSAFAFVGAAGTQDLFTFYLFWELACLTSFFLAFSTKSKDSAFHHIVSSGVSSSFIFLGIALTYAQTNSVAFSAITLLADKSVVLGLLLTGFGLRTLLFPLQFWAPALYSDTPLDTSAFFAGILNKLGVLAIFRLITTVGEVSGIITPVALVTIGAGTIFAFSEKSVKKRLAYANMAHIGYFILAFSLVSNLSIKMGLSYMVSHAVAMTLVFLALGEDTLISRIKLSPLRRIGFLTGMASLAGVLSTESFALLSILTFKKSMFVALSVAVSALYYYPLFLGETTDKSTLTRSQKIAIGLLTSFLILVGILSVFGTEIWEVNLI